MNRVTWGRTQGVGRFSKSCCGVFAIFLSWAAYADWHQVTNVPQWSQRSGHTSVVHGGKVWILGGIPANYYIRLTDTWSSEDGDHWSRALAQAPWAPRYYHTSVVFGGKMWIIGGQGPADIWASEDGINWTRMVEEVPWSYRYGQSAVVFDNAIWVMGGFGTNPKGPRNDVWRSYDGVNWSQVQPSAAWAPRCFHASTVHDGKMWIAGGGEIDDAYGTPVEFNDVWSSTDGISWTEVTAAAAWPPSSGCALVRYHDELLLTGTSNGEIWASADGAMWKLATEEAGWSWRSRHTSVVFNNRVWILGGYANYNVWSSSDGRTWSTTLRTVPWGELKYAGVVTRGDTCWLTAGYPTSGLWHDIIWRTSDAINWSIASPRQPWSQRYEAGMALYEGRLWLVGGWYGIGDDAYACNDVWSSTDGSNWTQVQLAAPWVERKTRGAVLVYAGKLWVVGGMGRRDVWNTTDGVNWTRTTATAPWTSNEPQGLVHDNRMWVRAESNHLWSTTDGANWRETANAAPVGTQVELNGRIWVFEPAYDGRMWSSMDGETWTLSDVKVPFGDRKGHTTFVYNDRLWVIGGDRFEDEWYFQEQEVPFGFTVLPQGGWKEEGAPWQGRVEAVGLYAATYQWRKDGVDIPGATMDTFSIPTLALTDSASYTCVVTDAATGSHETPPARLDVFAANTLPGPGPIALVTASLAICFFAARNRLGLSLWSSCPMWARMD